MEGHSRKSFDALFAGAPSSERGGLVPSENVDGKQQVKNRIASRKNAGRRSRSGVFFGGNAA
jgi:hypothetical protein